MSASESRRRIQEESKFKKDATYSARKAKALSQGTEFQFLVCPLCGRNRPIEIWGNKTLFKVKPTYYIIQNRKGGGRGIGFFLIGGVKLNELAEEDPEVWNNLRKEVSKLYSALNKLQPFAKAGT